MRSLLLVCVVQGVALGDVSIAGREATPACGGSRWLLMREAIDAYCHDEAAPSEQLGCRVARYSFTHCAAAPELARDDDGALTAAIRDPRDTSYAWLFTFTPLRRGWTLSRFTYQFDDCDAMGIPPPPRGPLDLSALRLDIAREIE